MLKYFSLLFILGSSIVLAQGIQFEKTSFQEILAKAKNENKLVFMDAYAVWCGPCKLMDKNVFTDEKVGAFFNTTFVNAKIDMEKGEGKEIAKKYGVYSYPTFLFLNGDGDIVHKSLGYQDAGPFLNAAMLISNPEGTKASFKERFENGEKDLTFLFDLIIQNYQSDRDFAQRVSERYFEVKPADELTREDVMMLVYFLKTKEDKNYIIFKNNKSQLLKFFSEEEYAKLDNGFQLNAILNASINETTLEIDEKKYYQLAGKEVSEVEAKEFLNRFKFNYLPSVGKYKEYAKVAVDLLGDGSNVDNNELLKASFVFSQYILDKELIKQAVIWAEKAIMRVETGESTYILAKLYSLVGKTDEAKMYAEQSVQLFKNANGDYTYPLQLLSELNKKK